jgi:hypothetical protein
MIHEVEKEDMRRLMRASRREDLRADGNQDSNLSPTSPTPTANGLAGFDVRFMVLGAPFQCGASDYR